MALMARRAMILLCSLSLLLNLSWGELQVGFYDSGCPAAESIVSSTVQASIAADQTIAASLLRLHFHDCFVQGCDGSVLIDGATAEKTSPAHAGLRGFEVINTAKSQLERVCPGVVSCSDIVALAARDSVSMSGGPTYQVETGRRDGRVSVASDADNMPTPDDPISVLKAKFSAKGLSDSELVLLSGGNSLPSWNANCSKGWSDPPPMRGCVSLGDYSGGHTIGTTACFFVTRRLYGFTPNGGSDPSIDPSFLPELQATCPRNGNANVRLALDRGSQTVFDKSILNNIRSGFAVLASDAQLYQDPSTQSVVDSYFGLLGSLLPGLLGPSFEQDFASAIVKMGQIGVKTGSQGEIRRVCSRFN